MFSFGLVFLLLLGDLQQHPDNNYYCYNYYNYRLLLLSSYVIIQFRDTMVRHIVMDGVKCHFIS